jgi:hypothetical protein
MLVIANAVKRSQARIDCFAALAMTGEKSPPILAQQINEADHAAHGSML